MADPLTALGVGSSIIQVAGAGLALSKTLYAFADSVLTADAALKAIASEIGTTSNVLEQLGRLLAQDSFQRIYNVAAVKTTSEAAEGCRVAFERVERALQKCSRRDAKGKLLAVSGKGMWFLRESKVEGLRRNLDRAKTTLTLMLQVLTCARGLADRQVQGGEKRMEQSSHDASRSIPAFPVMNMMIQTSPGLLEDESTPQEDDFPAMNTMVQALPEMLGGRTAPQEDGPKMSISSPMSRDALLQQTSECIYQVRSSLRDLEAAMTLMSSGYAIPTSHVLDCVGKAMGYLGTISPAWHAADEMLQAPAALSTTRDHATDQRATRYRPRQNPMLGKKQESDPIHPHPAVRTFYAEREHNRMADTLGRWARDHPEMDEATWQEKLEWSQEIPIYDEPISIEEEGLGDGKDVAGEDGAWPGAASAQPASFSQILTDIEPDPGDLGDADAGPEEGSWFGLFEEDNSPTPAEPAEAAEAWSASVPHMPTDMQPDLGNPDYIPIAGPQKDSFLYLFNDNVSPLSPAEASDSLEPKRNRNTVAARKSRDRRNSRRAPIPAAFALPQSGDGDKGVLRDYQMHFMSLEQQNTASAAATSPSEKKSSNTSLDNAISGQGVRDHYSGHFHAVPEIQENVAAADAAAEDTLSPYSTSASRSSQRISHLPALTPYRAISVDPPVDTLCFGKELGDDEESDSEDIDLPILDDLELPPSFENAVAGGDQSSEAMQQLLRQWTNLPANAITAFGGE